MCCIGCGRCCMPTFSILILLALGGAVAAIIITTYQLTFYDWTSQMYNYVFALVILGLFLLFTIITSFYGLCMCCRTGKGCQTTFIVLIVISLLFALMIPIIAYGFPDFLIADKDLWKRVESTANPTDLKTIVSIENSFLCCGYEYTDDWDKIRCAAYLTNKDFMNKWINSRIYGCKIELINYYSDQILYCSLFVGGIAMFLFVLLAFAIGSCCTPQNEASVISLI